MQNITNNTINVVNVTSVQQPLPGLVASLQNTLNQTLRIEPALSALAATDGAQPVTTGRSNEAEDTTPGTTFESSILRAQQKLPLLFL